MRLTARQRDVIRIAADEVFGTSEIVRLFGSRADDSLRGGDIGVHIEAPRGTADVDYEVRFCTLVWKMIDEKQLGVVLVEHGAEPRWIDVAARREGVVM